MCSINLYKQNNDNRFGCMKQKKTQNMHKYNDKKEQRNSYLKRKRSFNL